MPKNIPTEKVKMTFVKKNLQTINAGVLEKRELILLHGGYWSF